MTGRLSGANRVRVPYGWYEVRVWAVTLAGCGPSCTAWVLMWRP
jgi:hypothetical protein